MSSKPGREELNMLSERRRELESKLNHIERQLFTLEGKYLESTGGVLIAEAEHYIHAATAAPHAQKMMKKKQKSVAPENRIFSLSSVTAFEANNKTDPGQMGYEIYPTTDDETQGNAAASSNPYNILKSQTLKRARTYSSKSKKGSKGGSKRPK